MFYLFPYHQLSKRLKALMYHSRHPSLFHFNAFSFPFRFVENIFRLSNPCTFDLSRSKNIRCPGVQKPVVLKSRRASLLLLAVRSASCSPSSLIILGFLLTSGHTSANATDVKSRILLWRKVTKPPFLHERA